MRVAFIVQYFKHRHNIIPIQRRLQRYSVPDGAEVIWHNDSRSDQDVFRAAVLPPHRVVESDNVHEIRGYNKLSELTDADYLVFMQDDDIPPRGARWLLNALAALEDDAQLALVGFFNGSLKPWQELKSRKRGQIRRPVERRHPSLGFCFQYCAWLNLGPFVVRRPDFISLGRFDTGFSEPGQPGIGFDHEYATRMWLKGYKSALMWAPSFRRGVGGRSSKATPVARRLRSTMEKANLARYESIYREDFEWITERVEAENPALKPRRLHNLEGLARFYSKKLHKRLRKRLRKAGGALVTRWRS